MKNIALFSSVCIFLFAFLFKIQSQTSLPAIYMSADIRKAYTKGTRAYDGLPGKNLWQNTCHYTIQAEMNPYSRELSGREWIEYRNNSRDTLNELIFHLYQDVNKKGSLRSFDTIQQTTGVTLGLILVAGDSVREQDMLNKNTILSIKLKNPLLPESTINMEINWKVQITKSFIREGYVDSTSAFIGLWYPKMAVYDDIFGWDNSIYNLKEEFYSPLSTYDVSITLPKGFCVWATGKLQNPDNFPVVVNERLNRVFTGNESGTIIDSTTTLDKSQMGRDPWKFHADSVPDFAFGFSDHFLWDAAILNLGARKVLISTVYPKNHYKNFRYLNRVVRDAIENYSLKDPGFPYPYPFFTTFYGLNGGGMEYPMISFDDDSRDSLINSYVTIHEMLHSYLPFYLRMNETLFAWMDEGITDFYTLKMIGELGYNPDNLTAFNKKNQEPGILGLGNLPLLTPSTYWNPQDNMWGMMYIKPAQMLASLEDMVGAETWKKCFVSFLQTWKYKSPITYDFIFFVNNYLKNDLNWFWDKWFMHFGYPDLAIQKVEGNKVTLENRGLLPIPFTVHITDGKGKVKDVAYHADVWKNTNLMEINVHDPRLINIEVKCDEISDYELKDNIWKK
jgi:hypothetical protein